MKRVLLIISVFMLVVAFVPMPVVAPTVTRATYFYEKDDGGVPPGATAAINRLNVQRKIVADFYEIDSLNGEGKIPKQYVESRAEAMKHDLPCLVVMADKTVVKAVEVDPKSKNLEEEIVEAVP